MSETGRDQYIEKLEGQIAACHKDVERLVFQFDSVKAENADLERKLKAAVEFVSTLIACHGKHDPVSTAKLEKAQIDYCEQMGVAVNERLIKEAKDRAQWYGP